MSTQKLSKFFNPPVYYPKRNEAIADQISNALKTSEGFKIIQQSRLLYSLNPDIIHMVISNPLVPLQSCMRFFNLLSGNPSLSSSEKLDIRSHMALTFRMFGARKYAVAKNLVNSMVVDEKFRYTVMELTSLMENCSADARKRVKFCDMLLRLYAENKRFCEAVQVFDRATELGLEIEERSCMLCLIQLKRSDMLDAAVDFFEKMMATGVQITVYSLSLMVDCLCKKGEVEKAMELVSKMVGDEGVKPNAYAYNSLIDAYMKKNDFRRVNAVLGMMDKENVARNVTTYTLLIDGYASNSKIEEGESIFDDVLKKGIDCDLRLYTAMIDWSCRVSDMRRAFKLFDEMCEKGLSPNAHTYGALINGLCKAGQMDAAEILLREMQGKGIELNQVVFNTLIDGYCRKGMIDEALRLKDVMERIELVLDVYAHNSIATGLCKLNRLDEAKAIFYSMEDKGLPLNVFNFTTLIDIHCKEGNFTEANRVFTRMQENGGEMAPSIVTYNAFIDGYSKKGRLKEAYKLREEMERRGLAPDVFTYTSLIHGECIHGRVDRAIVLFNEMKTEKGLTPNVVSYTAMISGLAKEGRSDEAFRLYDEMKNAGITPDNNVYALLAGSFDSRTVNNSTT